MSYYKKTAYDSTKDYNLPPIDTSKMGFRAKDRRRNPINHPKGVHCDELLSFSDINVAEALQQRDDFPEEKQSIENSNLHEEYQWASFKNPKVIVETLTGLLGFYSIIAIIFGGGFIIYHYGVSSLLTIDAFILIWLPVILHYAGKYLLRSNLILDKNNVVLNRRTGMVTMAHNGKQVNIPFSEIDPYYNYSTNVNTVVNYQLWFIHRLSEVNTISQAYHYELYNVFRDWELWQQYMDISKPLPDIPEFEAFRHKDPVTADFDKKHNRPKDYWKDIDYGKASEMQDASIDASEAYPWGATRKQALASGWQPSGFGQGDWLKQ